MKNPSILLHLKDNDVALEVGPQQSNINRASWGFPLVNIVRKAIGKRVLLCYLS